MLQKGHGDVGPEPQDSEEPRPRRRRRRPNCHASFCDSAKPVALAPFELEEIVGETDRAIADGHEYRDPDKRIARIGQHQRRREARGEDQQTAHGGRTGLLLMGHRDVFANRLADMRGAKSLDQQWSQRERQRKSRQPGQHRSKRLVSKNIEDGVTHMELVQRQVEHSCPFLSAPQTDGTRPRACANAPSSDFLAKAD